MTWVSATLARRRPDVGRVFENAARGGVAMLCERFWDRASGGFFWSADQTQERHVYGAAFAIFAGAAAHRAFSCPDALALARGGFEWLERYAHDAEQGGYREALDPRGRPFASPPAGRSSDLIGTPFGLKSSNAHLHLLEAFCELYRAAPDATLRGRIEELLDLLLPFVTGERCLLPLTFTRHWEPVDRRVSYGHLLEAAHLTVNAASLIGRRPAQGIDTGCTEALRHGIDPKYGGLFTLGRPDERVNRRTKVWWVQAEALNGLLCLAATFPESATDYYGHFLATWHFVKKRLLDRRHGGWFERVSRSGRFVLERRKAHRWKGAYHDVRALLDVKDHLRRRWASARDWDTGPAER